MKITIDTDILKKHNLTLGEYLILLLGSYDIDIINCQNSVVQKGLAERNLFKEYGIVLSNNNKSIIARIITESDIKATESKLDFEEIAFKLQEIYPKGNKAGKTYSWRGELEEIAQKLRTLVVKYNFTFTEKEAIEATEEYVASFQAPYKYMHTLKNFLLFTKRDKQGHWEMESLFMTIVENRREEKENNL